MANAKITDLTQATNSELTDDSLVYVVTDPGGTPASRKSTLARMGTFPSSWADTVHTFLTMGSLNAGDYTTGVRFIPARDGQYATGARVYWPGDLVPRTLKLSVYLANSGSALGSGTVAVNAAGWYSVTFSGPGTPVPLDPKFEYIVACWETSGTWYLGIAAQVSPTTPPKRFRDYWITSSYWYSSFDNRPASSNPYYSMELEPLLSG
jgi:Domain of unknown function (DUF4082)